MKKLNVSIKDSYFLVSNHPIKNSSSFSVLCSISIQFKLVHAITCVMNYKGKRILIWNKIKARYLYTPSYYPYIRYYSTLPVYLHTWNYPSMFIIVLKKLTNYSVINVIRLKQNRDKLLYLQINHKLILRVINKRVTGTYKLYVYR